MNLRQDYGKLYNEIDLNQYYAKNPTNFKWFKLLVLKTALKLYSFDSTTPKSRNLRDALFYFSIILRLMCISVLVYVMLIMIHESDSWIPLINIVFCIGIIVDLVSFIKHKKEHIGFGTTFLYTFKS
jgi:hypothetical protein